MKIQLSRSGFKSVCRDGDLKRLRLQFARQHYLLLPGLLDPPLLRLVLERIKNAAYSKRETKVVSEAYIKGSGGAPGILHFLLNSREMFSLIQEITDCGLIGSFSGRVWRMFPGVGHYLNWHDDMVYGRSVALSVNLSSQEYKGGALQIRRRNAGTKIFQVPRLGSGDGVIFQVAPFLEHRVTQVTGQNPRIIFTGWFYSKPKVDLLQRSHFLKSAGRARFAANPALSGNGLAVPPSVVFQKVNEKILLLESDADLCYRLDPVGSRAWELLARAGNLRTVFEAMKKEYRVSPVILRRDLNDLIKKLLGNGLLRSRS